MLVEFRVKNHRSLRDEQVLTLQAGPIGDKDDSRLRKVAGFSEGILPASVIYGANASGKSNVLSALAFMRDAVQDSHRTFAPERGVPRKAFAWGQCSSEPSLFEVVMLIDGVKFQYGFTVSDTRVLEEWLFAWPKGHQQKWFERDKQSFKFGPQLKGENKSIAEFTRENALFLSAAVQNNHSQLKPIFNWFTTIQSVNVESVIATNAAKYADRFGNELVMSIALQEFDAKNKDSIKDTALAHQIKKHVRALLKDADTGITDIRSSSDDEDIPLKPSSRIELKHQCKSADAWLPLDDESSGTRTLFRLAFPLFATILTGSIILVDELEASLHPALAEMLVRQFNDPVTNPKNAQLIFTTHDTNLLGTITETPVLRRDQIWLTEKDDEGATTLYPLTDFKPRKAENLERGYLQGRYGAIPFLGNFSVRAE